MRPLAPSFRLPGYATFTRRRSCSGSLLQRYALTARSAHACWAGPTSGMARQRFAFAVGVSGTMGSGQRCLSCAERGNATLMRPRPHGAELWGITIALSGRSKRRSPLAKVRLQRAVSPHRLDRGIVLVEALSPLQASDTSPPNPLAFCSDGG